MHNGSWIQINRKKGMVADIWKSGYELCLFVCCVFLFLIGEVRYVSVFFNL